jgi:hypothetical protein
MAESFSDQPIGSAMLTCPWRKVEPPKYWVEIELVGDDDQPIPWEEYVVLLPDGKRVPGFLDDQGFARLDGLLTSGTCQIQFPNLDCDAWEKIETAGPKEAAA